MASRSNLLAAIAALSVVTLAACATAPTAVPRAETEASPSGIAPPSVRASAAAPSPAGSASAFTCDDGTVGCAGVLAAGVHASSNFTIPLRLTVPDGWVNVRDIARTYEVEPARSMGIAGHPSIEVLAMNAIPDPASCSPVPLAGAGSGVGAFVDLVTGLPGLEASAPMPASIDGYQGQAVDFEVRSDWTAMCPDIDPDNPVVLMLTSTNLEPPRRHIAYTKDVRVRWIVLDVAGETVIVEMVAPAGERDAAMREEQPLVDSLDFTPRS